MITLDRFEKVCLGLAAVGAAIAIVQIVAEMLWH